MGLLLWILHKLLWLVVIVVMCLILMILIDVPGRLFLNGSVSSKIVPGSNPGAKRLIIYYQCILAKSDASSVEVREVWTEHGDVLVVDWSGNRFDNDGVTDNVVDRVMPVRYQYDEYVFVLSSMGGKLGAETALKLKSKMPGIKMKFVMHDTPYDRDDLQDELRRASYLAQVTGGPIINQFSGLYFKYLFVEPKPENIEPGVDKEVLAQRVA